jgi:hypothetical protein
MTTDNLPKGPKPASGGGNPPPGGASAQFHLPKHARRNSEGSDPYLLAVNAFKTGQDYSAKPSAYEKRRAIETVVDDGRIGPAMTVRFITFEKTNYFSNSD